MIVVDTNVIAYLFLQGARTAQSEAILRRDAEWAAPYLWRSEFCNVLSLYLRQGTLSLVDAQSICREAETLLQGREYDVSSADVLALAASSGCSAYDCEFVALARRLGVALVTSDKKLLKAFPTLAMVTDSFVQSYKSEMLDLCGR